MASMVMCVGAYRIVYQIRFLKALLPALGPVLNKRRSQLDAKYNKTMLGATPTNANLQETAFSGEADGETESAHVNCWLLSIFSIPSMARSTSTLTFCTWMSRVRTRVPVTADFRGLLRSCS